VGANEAVQNSSLAKIENGVFPAPKNLQWLVFYDFFLKVFSPAPSLRLRG